MLDFHNFWMLICAAFLQGGDIAFGQFNTQSNPNLIASPSTFQRAGGLKPNPVQNNANLGMLAQRHFYNSLMGRIMDINKSQSRKTNLNNVDEISEWKFTDPYNIVDTWAPPSGRWEYFGDWRKSDRDRLSYTAPPGAIRRTNIIKYFFRRGILFSPKLDGSDVPQQVQGAPVFRSGSMVII